MSEAVSSPAIGSAADGRGRRLRLALVAVASAALTYLLHHLPPLGEHAVEGVLVVVSVAALLVLLPALAEAGRHHPLLPVVLVAGPEQRSLRPATVGDLAFSAALQARALEHGFFVSLGPRFLRAYHRTFLDSPHAAAFVAEIAGQPVGILLGTLEPAAHRRWVLQRRGLALVVLAVPAMLARPIVAARFLRTRSQRYASAWRRHRRSRQTRTAHAPTPARTPAVLSHVAVLPGARGTGSGGALVGAFVEAAARQGAHRAVLVTLEGGPAERFYRQLGWTPGPVVAQRGGHPMRTFSLAIEAAR
jgi:GNAT superfamily N-acetyltransferase